MKYGSIILGIIGILLLLLSAIIAGFSFYSLIVDKNGAGSGISYMIIFAIILIIIAILCALVGSILGIIGILSKNENKIPSIVGFSLNLFTILSFLGSIIYGLFWLTENVKGRPFG